MQGRFHGTTQSGWAIPTTYGNTITFLALANYISTDKKIDCLASGDDMLIIAEKRDTAEIIEKFKTITQEKDVPLEDRTGIIIKSFEVTKDSCIFLSKIYDRGRLYTRLPDRQVKTGCCSSTGTDPEIIRTSVLGEIMGSMAMHDSLIPFQRAYAE